MSPTGDITYESQLFRAYDAPTAADRIRNPCYHANLTSDNLTLGLPENRQPLV